MQQLNSYRFYELGAKLHSLFCSTTQNRIADMFAPLTEAQALLDGFIKGDNFALESSKSDANRLLNKISALFNRYFIDPSSKQLKTPTGEDRVDPHEMAMIQTMVEKFEHALAAELNRAPTYLAGKCGIYSTFDLAENAQNVFAENLRSVIPSAAQDEFNSAGRALAFGLGTASAIHLLRAIEVTLKIYYEAFAGPVSTKAERTFSIYLKKLSTMADDEEAKARPDKRVVQMLAQIKDHYRNPLMTAENSVSANEATQLFGMASALISLMAEQITGLQKKGSKGSSKASASGATPLSDEEDDMYDFRMSQVG
ncbi:MAG: hypothetical protein WAO98_02320 [Alphaproteobacteria bacterium]